MRIKWQEKLTEGPRNPCPPGSPLGPGGPCGTERRAFTSVVTLTPQSPGVPSSWAVPICPIPPMSSILQLPKAHLAFYSPGIPCQTASLRHWAALRDPLNKSCPRIGHLHCLQGCCASNLPWSQLPQGGGKGKTPQGQ